MRKIGQIFRFLIPVIALAALVVFLVGAGRQKKAKAVYEAKVEQVLEAWNTGNVDLLDEIYAPGFVRHSPGAAFGDEDLEAIKKRALSLQKDFPGFQLTADETIVEGMDRGMTRWTWRWTNKDTGKEVIMMGCTISHGVDGKTVTEWEFGDWLGLFLQLGFKLVPPEE